MALGKVLNLTLTIIAALVSQLGLYWMYTHLLAGRTEVGATWQ